MDFTKYSFSLTDFETRRSKVFKHLRDENNLTDVTLVCGGDISIQAHKLVLSSISPVFQNMFQKNPHPHPLIFLKGVDIKDLEAVLDFIYVGEAEIEAEHFASFLETAADLEIEELAEFSTDSSTSAIKLGFIQNKDSESSNEESDENNSIENVLHNTKNENSEIVFDNQIQLFENVQRESFEEEMEYSQDEVKDIEDCKYEYVKQTKNASYFKRKSENPNLFLCDECDFVSNSYSPIERHMLENQHKAGRYMCKFCGLKTFKWKTLQTHMIDDHPVERLKCENCDFIGVSFATLEYHVKTVHLGQSFSCEQCSYKANTRGNVKVHTERVHYKGPELVCDRPNCDYKGTHLGLISHVKGVHKSCDECEYEAKGKTDLKQHKRKFHGMPSS